MSRAFIESDHSKHCLFVWFAVKKFSPTEILMFVVSFSLFWGLLRDCLSMFRSAGGGGGGGGGSSVGPHVRGCDSSTPLREK